MFFISKEEALEYGMTHHGKLYGVPSWVTVVGDGVLMGCPKFWPLCLYTLAAEGAFTILSYLLPRGVVLVSPITVGNSITVEDASREEQEDH